MSKVWFNTATVDSIGGATNRFVQQMRSALQRAASRSPFAFARPAGSPGGTAAAMFVESMTRCC